MSVRRLIAAGLTTIFAAPLVAPAVGAAAPWDPVVALSQSSPAEMPRIVMSTDGTALLVVWKAGSSILGRRSRDAGATWDGVQTLASDAQVNSEPRIAAASDLSRATVMWERNDNTLRSAVTRDAGGTWTAGGIVTTSNAGVTTDLAASSDGQRVTAVWWELLAHETVFAKTSTDGGQTWGSLHRLSPDDRDGANPQVVGSADGQTITAAWSPFGGGEVRTATSYDGGETWGAGVEVSLPGGARNPDLTAAADGTATVVWEMPNVFQTVYASTRTAGMWSPAVAMSQQIHAQKAQVVAAPAGNRLLAGWGTTDGRLQVATSDGSGASWSTPFDATFSAGLADFALASSEHGRYLAVVWTTLRDLVSVTSNDGGATWSAQTPVGTGSGDPFYPKLTSSADGGTLGSVWHRNTSGTFTVEFAAADVPIPRVVADPLGFGDQQTGSTAARTLTVTNAGTLALKLGSVQVTGTGFTLQSQTCTSAPVAPAGTCSITVDFAPATVGPHDGLLTVTDNTDVGTHAISVDGTGVQPTPPDPTSPPSETPQPTNSPAPTGGPSSPPGPEPSPTQEPAPLVTLTVSARRAGKILLRKRTTLLRSATTNGSATAKVTCTVKGKPVKGCGARVSGMRVTAKPTCSKRLRIAVTITATRPGASPTHWNRAWTVKAKKPVKCRVV